MQRRLVLRPVEDFGRLFDGEVLVAEIAARDGARRTAGLVVPSAAQLPAVGDPAADQQFGNAVRVGCDTIVDERVRRFDHGPPNSDGTCGGGERVAVGLELRLARPKRLTVLHGVLRGGPTHGSATASRWRGPSGSQTLGSHDVLSERGAGRSRGHGILRQLPLYNRPEPAPWFRVNRRPDATHAVPPWPQTLPEFSQLILRIIQPRILSAGFQPYNRYGRYCPYNQNISRSGTGPRLVPGPGIISTCAAAPGTH